MPPFRAEYLQRLEAIYREIDGLAASLTQARAEGLVCRRGCHECCTDDLTVLEVEAELIRSRHADLLAAELPAPPGGCAFLAPDGSCRIYSSRPYICRTQGLPLRWQQGQDGEQEGREICPLNREAMAELGESPEAIPADQCWTLGPWEARLHSLQAEASGRFEPVRVALRALFTSR